MRKLTKQSIDADFTEWRRHRYDEHGLYLPLRVVGDLEAEAKATQEAEDAVAVSAAKEQDRKREEDADKPQAEERRKKLQFSLAPVVVGYHQPEADEVARHQIFLDIDAVRERVVLLKAGAVNGDKDLAKRETKALEAALLRGATRSIVRPLRWRVLIEELARELPAFRLPLELLSQSFALADRRSGRPAIPPMLLVGPPGVGKSYFARRLSEALRCGHAWMALDQRTAGTTLRGSDSHWSNAKHGLLFEHLALGRTANPIFVLDEIDKASRSAGQQNVDMLAQLYSVLEPETARHVEDISLSIELDASQVMYIATANDLRTLDAPLLSRFEVFRIELPGPQERLEATRRIVASVLVSLDARKPLKVSEGCYVLLAQYSPRVIRRAAERALAITVSADRDRVSIEDVERALGIDPAAPQTPGAARGTSGSYLH